MPKASKDLAVNKEHLTNEFDVTDKCKTDQNAQLFASQNNRITLNFADVN